MSSSEDVGRQAAERVRAESGLGTAPISDPIVLAELRYDADVAVVEGAAESHGVTVVDGDRRWIGVATTPHPYRQRFTVAHELGHLEMGTLEPVEVGDETAVRDDDERSADAFARHLLLPLDAVRGLLTHGSDGQSTREPGIDAVALLVCVFGVSPVVAAIQLRRSGLAEDSLVEDAKGVSARDLATRFGWLPAYEALAAVSDQPQPPRRLLARAVRAYSLGVLGAAAVTRLMGRTDIGAVEALLAQAGAAPIPGDPVGALAEGADTMTVAQVDALLRGEAL